MRMMLRFTLPVEKGNQAFNDGSLGRTMESVMTKLKPEAAYFAPLDGKRSGMLFFDIAEPSQIVEVVEPLFLNLDAAVDRAQAQGNAQVSGLATSVHLEQGESTATCLWFGLQGNDCEDSHLVGVLR